MMTLPCFFGVFGEKETGAESPVFLLNTLIGVQPKIMMLFLFLYLSRNFSSFSFWWISCILHVWCITLFCVNKICLLKKISRIYECRFLLLSALSPYDVFYFADYLIFLEVEEA